MKKSIQILTLAAIIFTTIQGMIPAMPLDGDGKLLSVILMYLVTVTTIWKQLLSKMIDNNSIIPTILLGVAATLGGLNDLFSLVQVPELAGQWIRFGVTAIAAILNMVSHTIWPSIGLPENKTSKPQLQ